MEDSQGSSKEQKTKQQRVESKLFNKGALREDNTDNEHY